MMKKRNPNFIEINKEVLYDLYYNQNMSILDIADLFYVSHVTILNRFKDYGFTKRTERSTLIRAKKERDKKSRQ
jgi:transcriptional antiterminator